MSQQLRWMKIQNLGPLLSILVLAPMAMAPKGCSSGTVGDDCPATMPCGDAGSTSMGNGGSNGMGTAGGTGKAGSTSIAGSTSMGNGGSGTTGTVCGGMLGDKCANASDYCDYPITAICGFADATGTCQPRPQACDDIYAPVCGCDGKTYPSDCVAATAGVSVHTTGECAGTGGGSGTPCGGTAPGKCGTSEFCEYAVGKCLAAGEIGTCTTIPQGCTADYVPVCGCDGKTYGNSCSAASVGVSIASNGECSTTGTGGTGGTGGGTTCGGITGAKCGSGEYCYFATQCGSGDMAGTCTKLPGACDTVYAPVCGCDGKTYGNECSAAANGVSVLSDGACK